MKRLVIICGAVLLFPRLAVSDGYWVTSSVWNVAQTVTANGENYWGRAQYKEVKLGCAKCGCPHDRDWETVTPHHK